MKTKHPVAVKFASLLSLAFCFATQMAGAQTSYYYTSGSGATAPGGAISGGSLASIGFDSYQTSTYDPVEHSDPGNMGIGADGFGGYFYNNYTFAGLATTLGDGSTLESVDVIVFVESVSPGNSTTSFQIYDGLGGTGNPVGTISLSHPGNELNFFAFNISAAILNGGFSIGSILDPSLTVFSTESNAVGTRTPMIVANYSAVPEPSAALLGGVGAFGLLRRRRKA